MKPEEQLNILRKIWGRNRKGYVFLPWIAAEHAATPKRKQMWQEDQAFHWPRDRDEIIAHLYEHAEDELYFSVQMFATPVRRASEALVTGCLYADLDEVNPASIPDFYRPTHAWQTSPGRYAAAWEMNGYRKEATEAGMENHKLTMFVGADPSGWDTTQLLRVPGSVNNKAEVIKANGKPYRGKLVWANRELHGWDKMEELPEVDIPDSVTVDRISEELLSGIRPKQVWDKIRLKVSAPVRAYMRMRDTEDLDRSDVLWQINCDLAQAGCSLAEIVAITRDSIWNKYEGRQDELKRLFTEATKALTEKQRRTEDGFEPLEPEEGGEKPKISDLKPFWEDESYLNAPEPEWLVEGFIPKGGCGFISGSPKSLKSWLALDLAISTTNAIPFLDYPSTRPINVLYIQQEDHTSTVLERHIIIASSKAPNHVPGDTLTPSQGALYMIVQKGYTGTDAGWQAWLSEAVEELKIELVIFDTLSTISNGIDIDKAGEVKRQLLDPVKVIARAHDCAMLFVHHNTKAGGNSRAGQNMAGSGQIHAWADMGIYITDKTNDNKITFDLETKFTQTNRLTYHLSGLDNDPKEWLPREVLKDESAGSGREVDLSTVRIPAKYNPTREARHAQQAKAEANRATVHNLMRQGITTFAQLKSHAPDIGETSLRRHMKSFT